MELTTTPTITYDGSTLYASDVLLLLKVIQDGDGIDFENRLEDYIGWDAKERIQTVMLPYEVENMLAEAGCIKLYEDQDYWVGDKLTEWIEKLEKVLNPT